MVQYNMGERFVQYLRELGPVDEGYEGPRLTYKDGKIVAVEFIDRPTSMSGMLKLAEAARFLGVTKGFIRPMFARLGFEPTVNGQDVMFPAVLVQAVGLLRAIDPPRNGAKWSISHEQILETVARLETAKTNG